MHPISLAREAVEFSKSKALKRGFGDAFVKATRVVKAVSTISHDRENILQGRGSFGDGSERLKMIEI